jgi:subtilisin family serine protease
MWFLILLAFVFPVIAAEHKILRLEGRPDEAQLRSQGIKLVEQIGRGEWIVSGEAGVVKGERIPGKDKLVEELRDGQVPEWAKVRLNGQDGIELLVYFHKDVSADEAWNELDRMGAELVERSDYFGRITARLRKTDLNWLLEQDWVRFVDAVFAPMALHSNAESAAQLKSTDLAEGLGLKGQGARIAVVDGLVDAHPELAGRLQQVSRGAVDSHGTHVAGTVAAAGNDPRLRGIAPEANIISYIFTPSSAALANLVAARQVESADLATNSYGIVPTEAGSSCNEYGRYDGFAREVDTIVSRERYSLVFSAGNQRDEQDCAIPARAGFYTISSPATAKNVISVGAVDKDNLMSTFSSAGPTKDGRLKPDVVARGVSVLSLNTNNRTQTLSGTSMSTPAVSGLAGLLVERFRQKAERAPEPDLLKAILLNTANDLGNPGPDYTYGYGIPDGVKAVQTIDNASFRREPIATGQTTEFNIEVADGSPALRVMLVWADLAAPVNAARTLMNDLDLRLVSPGGEERLPLTLDPARPAANATPGENTRDNVEQVVIDRPAAGTWKVIVRAKELVISPQNFALTWTTAENPAPPCSTTIFPTTIAANEGEALFSVQVSRSTLCEAWRVETSDDWLRPSEIANDNGSGVVKVRVTANGSGQQRSSTITVAGKPVTVRQSTACVSQAIQPGTAVTGRLSEADCFDLGTTSFYAKLYTFEATAGQRATITLESAAFDAFLTLLGPGGIVIAEDDDSGGGSNSRIPANGTLELPVGGRYTVIATTFNAREVGGFTLRVQLDAATGASSVLPKVVESCPAEISGELSSGSSSGGRRGDFYRSDIYLFEGRIGQEIRITAPESSFDPVLYLLGPTGALLNFNDDFEGSKQPQITRTLTANGIYRVEISSFAPFVTGSYKLQVNGCAAWSFR